MARNVLIATLGDSPIIVTSMVKALQEKMAIKIDQLQVIHPKGEQLIGLGYDMIADHLKGKCDVDQCELPFPDTNSHETSMKFLQILSGLIKGYESAGYNVYLSLAGGRKNMSALMAVTCQFFQCVRGLYHILDKHEDNPKKRNFHLIEALFDFEEKERNKKLSPPADDLILIKIPYPRLSNPSVLRDYFSGNRSSIDVEAELNGELDAFYSDIFQKKKTKLLDVYLSKEAHDFYQKGSGDRLKRLKNCFRSMQNLQTLENKIHSLPNAKTDCTCFKMGDTDERPFYYQTGSKVVVATIVQHKSEYKQIANGTRSLYSQDHPPLIHVNKLEEDRILIAPLGKSPMVVTQTFELLSKREGANIKKVIVIHPKNAEIRNGVNMLREAFYRRKRDFEPIEIPEIDDVASNDDCKTYLKKLVSVIKAAQSDNFDKSIYLSLSGGRKGMAALTLFAAQQANIDAVYHTLIKDIALEEKIEEETALDKLQELSRVERVRRLFLDAYDESKFELFRVPVIPIL